MVSLLNRQKRFRLLFHLAVVLVLLAGCSIEQPQEVTVQAQVSEDAFVVAELGDEKVYAEDLRKRFLELNQDPADAKQQGLEERKRFLEEEFIGPYLKLQCAYDKGYGNNPAYERIVDRTMGREGANELYNREVVNKVITTEVKMNYYNQMKQELKAEHIQEIPPFEEMEKEIIEKLQREMAKKIDLRRVEYSEQLFEEWQVVFHSEALRDLLSRIERQRVTGEQCVSYDELPMVLASYPGGQITTKDVMDVWPGRKGPITARVRPQDEGMIETVVKKMLSGRLFMEKAKQIGIHELPSMKEKQAELYKTTLINAVQRDEIWNKISIGQDEIEQYFEEHKDELAIPAVVIVREYYVKELDEAQRIWDGLRAVEDPDERSEALRELAKERYREGKRNIIDYDGMRGPVGDIAFGMQIGEMEGPIQFGKSYVIFQLLEKKPPIQPTLIGATDLITKKLKEEKAKPATKKWLTALRQQYPVKIYEDALMRAF